MILAKANITNARHVVAALDSEMDNLLISITCHDIDEKISVYAKSSDPSIANRLRKAGVHEVVSPFQLCAERVASLSLA